MVCHRVITNFAVAEANTIDYLLKKRLHFPIQKVFCIDNL